MTLVVWLVVGGLIGWLASTIMRIDSQHGAVLNVVVGVAGAMLGGWLIAPLVGGDTINRSDFSASGLMASLLGAVVLLGIVNLLRRGGGR